MTADERTPLLENGITPNLAKTGKAGKAVGVAGAVFGPANRLLLAGFMMSFTLGINQVPLVCTSS